MSATAPLTRPRPKGRAPQRPPLRLIVAGPLVGGRAPFVALVGLILAGGLVGLLMLHTLAAQDAFRLQQLQRSAAQVADAEQQLEIAVQERQDPAALAARARALGMVPATSLAFVRLHKHGRIVGVAHAAAAPAPPPAPAPAPTATATAAHADHADHASGASSAHHGNGRAAHRRGTTTADR